MGFGPVIIYGAGVCGLAIAQGLRMSNTRYYIFEPLDESAFTSSNSYVTISQSLALLQQLLPKDIVDQMQSIGKTHDNTTIVVEGTAGRLIGNRQPCCQRLTINKTKLRDLCTDDIDVKHRHVLQNVEYTEDGNIYAVFTNGERYWGSLLVGADGPFSLVRQMIFGEEKARPKLAGAEYVDLSLTLPPEVARMISQGESNMVIGAAQDCTVSVLMVDRPDPDRPTTWRFHLSVCWKKQKKSSWVLSSREIHRMVKEKAACFDEPLRSAITSIPNDIEISIEEMTRWTPTPWHSRGGRITLAGSAAHASMPSGCRNLDNAIEDAYSFVHIIKKIVVGDGIKSHTIPAYGHEIVARALRQTSLEKDVMQTVLDHTVLTDGILSKQALTRALNGRDSPETQSQSSSATSVSEKSDKSRRQEASKSRRALLRTSTWFRNQIDNLDVGAERGTAQTGWAQLGQREYGKRNFPDRDYRQFR